jgi:dienelactone hydrolase
VRLTVLPDDSLFDEPLLIRIDGLPSGVEILLEAEAEDATGVPWQSRAAFRSDEAGSIDPAGQAPLSGTYAGVDPAGLLWSMSPLGGPEDPRKFQAGHGPLLFRFTAAEAEAVRTSFTVVRRATVPGVKRTQVQEGSLSGAFYQPASQRPVPGVVLFHGSGGGIAGLEPVAGLLASHGYAAFVVGYFGVPGLPGHACEIPLESLATGIRWMADRPEVDASRLAAAGTSLGAEAVLAMASFLEGLPLKAVVAMSPSSVLWQALTPGMLQRKGRWSLHGQGLPYVPMRGEKLAGQVFANALRGLFAHPHPLKTLPAYEEALGNQEVVAPASIPVERFSAPLLLLVGDSDPVWPSSAMSKVILERRAVAGGGQADELAVYADAGHLTLHVPNVPTTVRAGSAGGLDFGGTPAGDASAMASAWNRILQFLDRHL